MDGTTAVLALAWILVLIGLAGSVLPVIPGAPLLFGGLLLAAWADDFVYVGPWWLAAMGVMAALTFGVDLLAGVFGAKRFGASRRAILGAGLGAVVGIFFGLPGILLGPFVGAVAGELSAQKSLGEAGRAGLGATLGLALGAAAKLALGCSMIGIFLILRFM